jgi:hypothetical protein
VGEKDARETMEVVPFFGSYFDFVAMRNLGVKIDQKDIPTEKLVMWAWIEGIINGRKTKL